MPKIQELDTTHYWGELSVALLDDESIAVLNEQYLGHEGPTDVISFGFDPVPPETFHGGEVLVNAQRALEEGWKQQGLNHELAFYLAHGCHHLTGADDATEEQRAEMHRVELAWLEDAAKEGMLDHLAEA